MAIDKSARLGDLLKDLSNSLDIPPSKYDDAVSKYTAVGNWLKQSGTLLAPYSPQLYPQGSFAIGTVVPPIVETDEYDLDLVCELQVLEANNDPYAVWSAIGQRLAEHATYKKMLEPCRRCWRLNYAGEFHMDVVPAALASDRGLTGTRIQATDHKIDKAAGTDEWLWRLTDPKGYAAWFRKRMEVRLLEEKRVFAERHRASIADVPDDKVKTPLQRAVQILKRHRDIRFNGNDRDDKPVSIIITTLAAHAYDNEASLYDAMIKIVRNMHLHIENRNGQAWVPNPVNPAENLADKWREYPKRQKAFFDWLGALNSDLDELERTEGVDRYGLLLESRFGQKAGKDAIRSFSDRYYQQQKNGALRMNAGNAGAVGLLGAVGSPVKGHTFHG